MRRLFGPPITAHDPPSIIKSAKFKRCEKLINVGGEREGQEYVR